MGWPMTKGPRMGCEMQKALKVNPMREAQKGNIVYIGIAADETNRFHNLNDTKKSPLLEARWTEARCWNWCRRNDLLSPIYTTAIRGGCWFCPNQSIKQLRHLRKHYPEYWALMLKWDNDSPVSFHPSTKRKDGTIEHGRTVHDFERRFQAEDDLFISEYDKVFRWCMLDEELNYRLF